MKIRFLWMLLCSIALFTACGDDEDRTYIPTTDFALPEGCRWNRDLTQEKIIRINDIEELKALFVCDKEIDFDFDKKTLLLVHFGDSFTKEITHQLYSKDDDDKLYLNITIHKWKGKDELAIWIPYYVVVAVDKLDESIPIELIIETKNE